MILCVYRLNHSISRSLVSWLLCMLFIKTRQSKQLANRYYYFTFFYFSSFCCCCCFLSMLIYFIYSIHFTACQHSIKFFLLVFLLPFATANESHSKWIVNSEYGMLIGHRCVSLIQNNYCEQNIL